MECLDICFDNQPTWKGLFLVHASQMASLQLFRVDGSPDNSSLSLDMVFQKSPGGGHRSATFDGCFSEPRLGVKRRQTSPPIRGPGVPLVVPLFRLIFIPIWCASISLL